MQQRPEDLPAPDASFGFRAQINAMSLGFGDGKDPAIFDLIEARGSQAPFDVIRKNTFTRETFVQTAAERLSEASEDLSSHGINKEENVYSFSLRTPAGSEGALMSLWDGANNTDITKAHLFRIGGNSMYFNGRGKLVGIELEWDESTAKMVAGFREPQEEMSPEGPIVQNPEQSSSPLNGTFSNTDKIKFNFASPLSMDIQIVPKKG